MLSKSLYINGFHSIRPDGNSSINQNNQLESAEPEYKEYLDPVSARRLGRLIKMALVASKKSLANASVEMPDAIITGTGFGCMEDTEKFLISMLDNELAMLSPTSFIQSTHNTISGQIALMLKCYGYNNTYGHRWLSFEHAMEDGIMLLEANEAHHILVGGADEFTERTSQIKQLIGLYCSASGENKYPIEGEGVHYFVVSDSKTYTTSAKILGLKSFDFQINPNAELPEFLQDCGVAIEKIDAVILGINGDEAFDSVYSDFATRNFENAAQFRFKNVVGENFTAVGFAWKLACELLQNQKANSQFLLKNEKKSYNNVLIYNQYRNLQHSFALLQNV